MRLLPLQGLATIFGILTVLGLAGMPFWFFGAATASMMEPGTNAWAFPVFADIPYVPLAFLWFCLWLLARATRP